MTVARRLADLHIFRIDLLELLIERFGFPNASRP